MKAYLTELFKRMDLIKYLVLSGLKSQHKNTYLGFFWWLLDPALQIMIYYFVVVVVFERARGVDYGIYLAIGLIVWRWIASSVTSATRSITSQSAIITQVYLPKATFPLCTVLSQMINFGFGLVIVAACLLFFQVRPGAAMIWLPMVISVQMLLLLAVSLMVAYLSVFVRDMEMLVRHFLRLGFYGSPVIWYADMIPERMTWLLAVNPVASLLEAYRSIIIHNTAPAMWPLAVIGVFSSLAVLLMIDVYHFFEHRIIKAL
jgi:ABC-type polysaccharide/polyol phosphate export permease